MIVTLFGVAHVDLRMSANQCKAGLAKPIVAGQAAAISLEQRDSMNSKLMVSSSTSQAKLTQG